MLKFFCGTFYVKANCQIKSPSDILAIIIMVLSFTSVDHEL